MTYVPMLSVEIVSSGTDEVRAKRDPSLCTESVNGHFWSNLCLNCIFKWTWFVKTDIWSVIDRSRVRFPVEAVLIIFLFSPIFPLFDRERLSHGPKSLSTLYELLKKKIRRGPKLEGCAFVNFGNSSGTEEEPSQKREKNGGKKKIINAAATGNRTRDLSITDQMSVLTNQVHLKIQFRHRFDQKCPFTDSLHRLSSRFAQTSSVPLEIIFFASSPTLFVLF